MKFTSLLLGLALVPVLFAAEPTPYELAVGSTLEEAKAVLGVPRGNFSTDDTVTYFFAAGEVTFRDGKLISCSLKSTAELNEQTRVAETMKKESTERTEKARGERLAKGERLRKERAKDPAFLAQTASSRLAAWREFRVQYPETDIQTELDATYREWQVEANEKQLADLKNHISNLMAQLAAKDREIAEIRADRESWKNRYNDLRSSSSTIIVTRDDYPRTPVPAPTPTPKIVVIPSTPVRKPETVIPTPVPAPVKVSPQSKE